MAAGAEIDWLAVCRRVVERQRELFAATPGIAARTRYDGVGEGGDNALVLDRRCEDAVFAELESLVAEGRSLRVTSEERGEVVLGDGDPEAHLVVDPIDGSLNTRRTIPAHSISLAVASGETMDTVSFGYVFDFGAGEEFSAERGAGARLNGDPISAEGPGYGLEIVGIESAEPSWILPIVESLQGEAYRLRAVGSIAISLSWLAAGRFDGMITARACRSVDAAAGQLIVREAGGLFAIEGLSLDQARLDLDARYRLVAALEADGLRTLEAVQASAPPVPR